MAGSSTVATRASTSQILEKLPTAPTMQTLHGAPHRLDTMNAMHHRQAACLQTAVPCIRFLHRDRTKMSWQPHAYLEIRPPGADNSTRRCRVSADAPCRRASYHPGIHKHQHACLAFPCSRGPGQEPSTPRAPPCQARQVRACRVGQQQARWVEPFHASSMYGHEPLARRPRPSCGPWLQGRNHASTQGSSMTSSPELRISVAGCRHPGAVIALQSYVLEPSLKLT